MRGARSKRVSLGPDLLGFVNGIELNGFYLDAQAAIEAGQRYVDAEEKAKREKAAQTTRSPAQK